jgi:hypothetical protein
MNKYNRDKHLYLNKNIIKYVAISSELNNIYVNNIKTNIFDESTLYLDSEGSIINIFNDTKFELSTLFNPIKSWNTWSLLSNPDITKDVLVKGNLQLDSSGNISLDGSNNYYTKSEISDLDKKIYKLSQSQLDCAVIVSENAILRILERRFGQEKKIEEVIKQIQEECSEILKTYNQNIPEFKDIDENQSTICKQGKWRMFMLRLFNKNLPNSSLTPNTIKLINQCSPVPVKM